MKENKIATELNYLDVHSTIPFDSTPLIFAGFRLHNTATFRFCICSNGTNFARPLTTYHREKWLMKWQLVYQRTRYYRSWFAFTKINFFHIKCVSIWMHCNFYNFTNSYVQTMRSIFGGSLLLWCIFVDFCRWGISLCCECTEKIISRSRKISNCSKNVFFYTSSGLVNSFRIGSSRRLM